MKRVILEVKNQKVRVAEEGRNIRIFFRHLKYYRFPEISLESLTEHLDTNLITSLQLKEFDGLSVPKFVSEFSNLESIEISSDKLSIIPRWVFELLTKLERIDFSDTTNYILPESERNSAAVSQQREHSLYWRAPRVCSLFLFNILSILESFFW